MAARRGDLSEPLLSLFAVFVQQVPEIHERFVMRTAGESSRRALLDEQLGQEGGDGADPGGGGTGACSGGPGGDGGEGGSGGGGRGGHSLAIAYAGTAPTTDETVTLDFGDAGAGGDGGVGLDLDNIGGEGAPGEAAGMLELPGE